MGGVRVGGRFAFIVAFGLGVLGLGSPPAGALEAFDGRLQLHGFYENQTRVMARNFRATDDWDLTQWYQVLNLEMELDIAPDGWGPFDLVSAYARVEVRYDCVYSRGCWMFPGANAFGDRAQKLPKRLIDARRDGWTDNQFTGDVRKRAGIPVTGLDGKFGIPFDGPPIGLDANGRFRPLPRGLPRNPAKIWNVSGVDTLFGQEGADGLEDTEDDPAKFILSDFFDFEFGMRKVRGSSNGVGTQVLGPWLPKNFVDPIAALAGKPNPFRAGDFNPIIPALNTGSISTGTPLFELFGRLGTCGEAKEFLEGGGVIPGSGGGFFDFDPDDPQCFGSGERPFRPAPQLAAQKNPPDQQFAQGIYYPNSRLAALIRDNRLHNEDQNFREKELQWNRGASQQQTKELKEFYFDIELLDSSLWLRLGRQSIVWGKTELFRTTDQFNPQDLALATLPSLEESRISLWAARAVYSLWSVGPLEDVRVELAANIDTFQGADFGQCGEPYTVNAACNIRAGMFAHGISGFGLAGVTRPPDPWEDVKGLEVGFRMEFRWSRFSFAITDFYGYDDFPYVNQIFRYSRNVDPFTGRPRRNESTLPCDPDGVYTANDIRGCLNGGTDALTNHHANQQIFAFVCSTTIGFAADLDPTVCAQSVFNSQAPASPLPINIASALGTIMTGDESGAFIASNLLSALVPPALAGLLGQPDLPFVDLGFIDRDGDGLGSDDNPANTFFTFAFLDAHLSPEQRALLGCGPFWDQSAGDACETQGIDLLNLEASALTSAWITQPGVRGSNYLQLSGPAAGTQAYVAEWGRFYCQRFVKGRGIVVLPGCRAPGESGFSFAIDGDPSTIVATETRTGGPTGSLIDPTTGLALDCPADGPGVDTGWCDTGNPFTGEPWHSSMDAFSWNFQMLLVLFSAIGLDTPDDALIVTAFDPRTPLALDKCSFAAPQFCSNVSALLSVMGRRRNSTLAGGNSNFGRHDFTWHGGSSNRLKWNKRNVLGFSADFAEDYTKTNWSIETTWIHDIVVADNDSLDGTGEVDNYNLTVSMDRPTFINFLNQNRTFFINTQWFFRYIDGFEESMPMNGPFNVLATLTMFTGFYQDRLNPSLTLVYDFMSESGAVLPSINYRFTESFLVEFGMALFYGKWQSTRMPLNPVSLGEQVGSGAYRDFSERGLGVVRDRDEVFVRLRKTF